MIENSQVIWAKSGEKIEEYERLSNHTIQTIQMARKLVSRLPFPPEKQSQLNTKLEIALAFHDVGKSTVYFQNMLHSGKSIKKYRHEILSVAFASEFIDDFYEFADEILFAILTHHRPIWNGTNHKVINVFDVVLEDSRQRNIKSGEWADLKNSFQALYPVFLNEWEKICRFIGREEWIEKAKHVCIDYIRLSSHWLNIKNQERIDRKKRFETSILRGLVILSDHLASTGAKVEDLPFRPKAQLSISNFRAFQIKSGQVNGHLILQAPTGSGKTEAAILWAENNMQDTSRLFYVLPVIASINAMFERLNKIYLDNYIDVVGMLHSRALSYFYDSLSNDEDMSHIQRHNEAKMLQQLSRKSWHPIRVLTPFQLLRQALKGKGWEPFLFESRNACFIFDEIHVYDPRITGHILGMAKLVDHLGAHCLFVSATMPEFLKGLIEQVLPNKIQLVQLDPNESSDRKVLDKKRHQLYFQTGNLLQQIYWLVEITRKYQSIVIICNQVKTAQEVYKALKKELCLNQQDIMLIHSRFNRTDRKQKEKRLKCSPLPRIVVATQVIEVSLDINFAVGVSEPCPIDALVQRMGRVNRKGENMISPAPFFIMEEAKRQLEEYKVFTPITVEVLKLYISSKGNILSEQDLVNIVNEVYKDGYSEDELNQFKSAFSIYKPSEYMERLRAGVDAPWADELFEEDSGTIEVLPEGLFNQYKELIEVQRWFEADELLVPITYNQYKLHKCKPISDFPRTNMIHSSYNSETGLDLELN